MYLNIFRGNVMFYPNLNHQAGVLSAIREFVEICLNHDITDANFKYQLTELVSAFEIFHHDGIKYDPYINAFILVADYINEHRSDLIYQDYLGQLSSKSIRKLKQIIWGQRANILENIRRFENQESDNRAKFLADVRQVLVDHYAVLVIRVDLGYLKKHLSQISIREFDQHITELRKALKDKNSCFRSLLTYGLALEQGVTRGFHAHLLLFYNGSKVQEDEKIAKRIMEKWKRITWQLGHCSTPNTPEKKAEYEKKGTLGVGKILRDEHKLDQFKRPLFVAYYLVSPDKFSQKMLLTLGNSRTFSKGFYKPHNRNYDTKFKQSQMEQGVGIMTFDDIDMMVYEEEEEE